MESTSCRGAADGGSYHRRLIMKSGMLGLVLLVTMPTGSMAQSNDPATRELIEKLLARIDSLEKRVVQLEQGNTVARTTPAAAVAQAHAHDQAPTPSTVIAAEAAQPIYPLIKISG